MGKIVKRAKTLWFDNKCMELFAEEIDFRLDALRQEIQDQKGQDVAPETNLRSEITEKAKQLFDNRLGWSEGRHPFAPKEFWIKLGIALYGENSYQVRELKDKEPTPEPELQRFDVVSYMDKGRKFLGIFHHYDGNRVYACWQTLKGDFPSYLGFMLRSEVTFELRPKK